MLNMTSYLLFTLLMINIGIVYYILNNRIHLLESSLNKQNIVMTQLLSDCATFLIPSSDNVGSDNVKEVESDVEVETDEEVEGDVETDEEVEGDAATDEETEVESESDDETQELNSNKSLETTHQEIVLENNDDLISVSDNEEVSEVKIMNLSDVTDLKGLDFSNNLQVTKLDNDAMSEDNISFITNNDETTYKKLGDLSIDDLNKMKVNELRNVAIFNAIMTKSEARKSKKAELLTKLISN